MQLVGNLQLLLLCSLLGATLEECIHSQTQFRMLVLNFNALHGLGYLTRKAIHQVVAGNLLV